MKITALRPFVVDCFRTNWVFLKVETDAGLHVSTRSSARTRSTPSGFSTPTTATPTGAAAPCS